MGRMFDMLKQSGRSQPMSAAAHGECVVDWSLRETEEVPFIEVGDGKKVEGSAQVMAVKHPPQPPVQPPHPQTEKQLAGTTAKTSAAKIVDLTETRPMTVFLELWPGPAPGRGVSPEIVTYHQPKHPISQQYADLFTKIMESQTTPANRALLLCGARPHVGASTVILNLGVIGAEQGKRRLVLVDAQRKRPTLADRLGVSAAHGLFSALAGASALEQAVMTTCVAGLHLLPAGAAGGPADPPTAAALAWLVGWLRARYDVILFDAPPWHEMIDAALLAPSCDGTFIVVPAAETAQTHQALAEKIMHQGGRLRGLIHTQVER